MTVNKKFLIVYKLFFALLGLSAVVTEIATIIERGIFNASNFFSYFTIETNIIVICVFLLSSYAVAMGKNKKLDVIRAAVTVYILIVGIGFAVLLAGLENTTLTAVPWDNIVLHYIIPVAVLIDYLIDRPATKILFKSSLKWLLFPVSYVVYSLVRGPIVDWYPYPFLNPTINGYIGVAVPVVGLVLLALTLQGFVCKLSGKNRRKA
ncbi:TPA: hypothetical protein EYO12_02225 [Candidatus Saccharibacteria bacterium]|nr:hypothetical protein [Candidatus Saccharibacteria bacterium]HIO87531.1 hypothetical protein [Candidatus Saccharibacteria bacterium]